MDQSANPAMAPAISKSEIITNLDVRLGAVLRDFMCEVAFWPGGNGLEIDELIAIRSRLVEARARLAVFGRVVTKPPAVLINRGWLEPVERSG